jgi:hypothetical protein
MIHAGGVFHENALRLMTQYKQVYAGLGVILWVQLVAKKYPTQTPKHFSKNPIQNQIPFPNLKLKT